MFDCFTIGNCAVIKPSEVACATAELLTELIPKYLDQVIYQTLYVFHEEIVAAVNGMIHACKCCGVIILVTTTNWYSPFSVRYIFQNLQCTSTKEKYQIVHFRIKLNLNILHPCAVHIYMYTVRTAVFVIVHAHVLVYICSTYLQVSLHCISFEPFSK